MVKRSVMVIDDDTATRNALLDVLGSEGYVTYAARNGKEALDQLCAGTRPEVILLDLMMPILTGWETMEALGKDERFAQIPVIVLSSSTDNRKLAAAKAWLRKPVDVRVLLETIRAVCGPEAR